MTAYHRIDADDKAIKGNKRYAVNWKGADWHFVTKADSKMFAANPEKFSKSLSEYTPIYILHNLSGCFFPCFAAFLLVVILRVSGM